MLALSVAATREQSGSGPGAGAQTDTGASHGSRPTGTGRPFSVGRASWDVSAPVRAPAPGPAPGFLGVARLGPWSGWQSIADESTARPWLAYGSPVAVDVASALAALAPGI